MKYIKLFENNNEFEIIQYTKELEDEIINFSKEDNELILNYLNRNFSKVQKIEKLFKYKRGISDIRNFEYQELDLVFFLNRMKNDCYFLIIVEEITQTKLINKNYKCYSLSGLKKCIDETINTKSDSKDYDIVYAGEKKKKKKNNKYFR